jgi:uncharacterized membrane protein
VNEWFLVIVGLAVAGGAVVFSIVLPIVSFVRTTHAVREAQRANQRLDALTSLVNDLLRQRDAASAAVHADGVDAPATASAAPAAANASAPERAGVSESGLVPDAAAPLSDAHPTPVLESPASAVEPAGPVGPPPVEAPAVVPSLPGGPVSEPAQPRPHAHAHVSHAPSLEQRIGQRWLLYVGIGALVLGSSYLVKLAFDSAWITPAMRVGLSAFGGLVLVAAGLRFADRGLPLFGHLLAGGGFAVVYVAIYAALHLYELIARGTAFGAMTLVTIAAAWLADRRAAQGLAMVALVGGFATPFLVGGDRDAFVALFTYVSLLSAGAAVLGRRHAWPALVLVAFVLITFTFGTWVSVNYRNERYLAIEAFLTIWLAIFLAAIAPSSSRAVPEREAAARAEPLRAGVALIVGVLAPLLYHGASLVNLARHTLGLLIYVIAATLAGVLFAADGRRTWARFAVWVAVWVPFLGWLSTRSNAAGVRITLFAIYGLHLLAELRTLSRDRARLDAVDTVLLHLNGLGLLAGLVLLSPRWDTHGMAAMSAGVAAAYALLAAGTRTRHDSAPLHYVALASACAAAALALRFEGAWVVMGWAVEGAFLVWLGLREARHWLRLAGGALIALSIARGLELLSTRTGVDLTAFLNAHALSMFAVAGLLLWVADRYRRAGTELRGGPGPAIAASLLTAATIVLLVITNEINRMYGLYAWQLDSTSGAMAAGTADLARQVTLSIVWAAYAVLLVAVGIARQYAPIRYLAIVLLASTIAKVVLVDLAELDRVYRVLSVIGLGLLLIVASYLYQRFMADGDGERAGGNVPPAPPV